MPCVEGTTCTNVFSGKEQLDDTGGTRLAQGMFCADISLTNGLQLVLVCGEWRDYNYNNECYRSTLTNQAVAEWFSHTCGHRNLSTVVHEAHNRCHWSVGVDSTQSCWNFKTFDQELRLQLQTCQNATSQVCVFPSRATSP